MTDTVEATQAAGRQWNLGRLLYNRRWVRRAEPFPHIVAQDVFVPEFYRQLEDDFRRIQRELGESFLRNMHGYDATQADLIHHPDSALAIFASREWHDMIARLMGVEATGDVLASLHHHEVGSKTGWPHNDLSPAWFEDPAPGPDEIRQTSSRVEYGHGPKTPDVSAHETIRAVSILYYLNNGAWQPGDGGETALFASVGDARTIGPSAVVAPIDNSMVIFECSPFTWHAFLSNRNRTRDSVVMWLHQPRAAVVERWGDHNIDYWK